MATAPKALAERCVNTIRFLSIDAVQQANSGHPGICMGAAPAAFVLWDQFLRHNPKNPSWFNRDRFVLSAGHGSMLIYSLLHLTGYDSVPIEEIKRFRQWGSRTPGHPETDRTPGVEVSTGPLGQGIANAVGLAIAEVHLAARFNKPDCQLIDHYTYALMGDGCQMEGISSEAASLAGHLGLGKLIALYDDNQISIDGSTDLTFTEDVGQRYEACGWHVLTVEDGDTDHEAIAAAIAAAKGVTDKPSLIKIRTTIGYGSPAKAGSSDCHGAPLGPDEVVATRKALGWTAEPFAVPDEVGSHMGQAVARGAEQEAEWKGQLEAYRAAHPAEAAELERMLAGKLPEGWEEALPSFTPDDPKKATRVHSGTCLTALAERISGMIGGSADLSPSNKTLLPGTGNFGREGYENRNLRFGVREQAMGAICNGIALHRSGLVPFCATFMVFTDYMRSSIRMSALSNAPVLYIMTHDSVAVGEDGPTHQPVEHVPILRAMPGLLVLRPADGNETAGAYKAALLDRERPAVLALSRQGVPHLPGTSADAVAKGAYVLSDSDGEPELILIGTGAELSLCAEAAETLRAEGRAVRVVSMPSWELFEAQDEAYRESVLPAAIDRRLAVEAGTSFGWHKWVGRRGDTVSIDRFGQSAPGAVCLEKFGFTAGNVLAKARALLG